MTTQEKIKWLTEEIAYCQKQIDTFEFKRDLAIKELDQLTSQEKQ